MIGVCIYNSFVDNIKGIDLFYSNNFIDGVVVIFNGKVNFRE